MRDSDSQASAPAASWRGMGACAPDDAANASYAAIPHQHTAGSRAALLARAIEQEIIPRLMLAHRTPRTSLTITALSSQQVHDGEVQHFAKLILSRDESLAPACLHAMRRRGLSVETLYLELLAPVACSLGELWERDLCDSVDLTIGLGRLQQLLRELSPAFCDAGDRPDNGRRLLLLPGPGEQRSFGLVIAAEFFHRAGWDISFGPEASAIDPLALVKREWFDLVVFSRAHECQTADLAVRIGAMRRVARNRQVVIMVGDPVLHATADYAALVRADAVANDGRHAPALADTLVGSRVQLC